jgi:hypothetical protein
MGNIFSFCFAIAPAFTSVFCVCFCAKYRVAKVRRCLRIRILGSFVSKYLPLCLVLFSSHSIVHSSVIHDSYWASFSFHLNVSSPSVVFYACLGFLQDKRSSRLELPIIPLKSASFCTPTILDMRWRRVGWVGGWVGGWVVVVSESEYACVWVSVCVHKQWPLTS